MHIDKKTMRNLFLCAAGSIILVWLLMDTERVKALIGAGWGLVSPFVVGAAIAFVFNVPMRAIERQIDGIRKLSLRRVLAVLLTLFALVLIVMFVVELLIPQFQMTFESLAVTIPAFVRRTADNLIVFMDANPEIKGWILDALNMETIDWAALLQNAITIAGNSISSIAGGAFSAIGSLTNGIVNGVISIVFAIYCLSRKEVLARQGRRLLYSLLPERTTDEIIRILRMTNTAFSNFISGQCLEAVILGVLFAVVMSIFKMPYIALVSVIIAVTALVPVVGAFVGCIVGAFFILVQDPLQAVTFVAMFLVLQQIEGNLIYPRVVGTSIGLPGMWVLVAVTVGGEIMGVGGMLIMIPLASVGYALLREFTQRRLAERNISPEKLRDQPPELKSQYKKDKEARARNIKTQKMKEKLLKMQKKK